MATALPSSPGGIPSTSAYPSPSGDEPSDGRLRAYTRLKLEVAAQVRALREHVRRQDDKRRLARCEALMVKLAEDRFTLAVLGQFKRGKSSLMNSIIGRDLLPIGVLPITSAITIVRFGPRERLLVKREHWASLEELPVSRLADFATEKGNPGNRERVQAAYVELPSAFLRRGLEFVDTPGIGSSVAANTATTYDFLPQCDAVLFVTSVEAPLNRVELEFLSDVRQQAAKMFFIVNKADLLSAPERAEVLDFVRHTLRDLAGIEDARVFPVSAMQGLSAKLRGDSFLLSQCGLANLEAALADFLTHQKAKVFLESVLDKLALLLRGAQAENDIRRRSGLLSDSAAEKGRETLQRQFEAQAVSRREIMSRLKDQFCAEVEARMAPEMDSFWMSYKVELSQQVCRLLARAHWLPGRQSSLRLSAAVRRLSEKAVRLRLMPCLLRSISAPSLPLLSAWEDLCLSIKGISRTAALAHGIASLEDDDPDPLPPFNTLWQEMTPPPPPEWRPSPPLHLAWLPTRYLRRRLAEFLITDSDPWLKAYRKHLHAAVNQVADDAFERWADEVEACAVDLEGRIRRGISGQGQKAVAEHHATLASLQRHLDRLREDLASIHDGSSCPDGQETCDATFFAKADSSEQPPHIVNAGPEITPEDMDRNLRIRGCAVCAHLSTVASDFLSKWQYALFTDEAAQEQFARKRGFCPRHQWQLEAISSPVGLSIGQATLVQRVGHLLDGVAQKPSCARSLRAVMPDDGSCQVCRLQSEAESRYSERLAIFVRSESGREAYARSQGLCLRHLDRLIAALAEDDETIRFILTYSARRFGEIAEDMKSYGMKTEALRRQLRNGDEEDAYWRATTLLAGSRNVCLPWPREH